MHMAGCGDDLAELPPKHWCKVFKWESWMSSCVKSIQICHVMVFQQPRLWVTCQSGKTERTRRQVFFFLFFFFNSKHELWLTPSSYSYLRTKLLVLYKRCVSLQKDFCKCVLKAHHTRTHILNMNTVACTFMSKKTIGKAAEFYCIDGCTSS